MKASIVFYANTVKKNSKSKKVPLYLRVVLNGSKAESRLNAEVTEDDLLKWDPFTMRFSDRDSAINHQLNNIAREFQHFLILNETKLSQFTAQSIRDSVMGTRDSKAPEFLQYAKNYYANSIVPNKELSQGTKINYRKANNHLRNFLLFTHNEHILLSEINNSFAHRFKDYLVSDQLAINKKAMTEVSASANLKKMRTLMARAIDEGYAQQNAFKSVKLKNRSPQRERLTISQVKQIYFEDFSLFPSTEIYRDLFLFSTFTGLAYSDAMLLKKSDLVRVENNEILLKVNRKKTNETTEVILVSFAKQIIAKFAKLPETQIKNTVLPFRSNKELNLQVKIIADKAGIPVKLSSHIARHTFRQLLSEAGIEDIGVIKKMMGHSRHRDIDALYYEITQSRLLAAKIKFEKYLQTNLL